MTSFIVFVRHLNVYVLSQAFLKGALVTLALTLVSMVFGVVLGLILALMKTAKNKPLSTAANGYIWLFRGTPVLLQLIFVYAALPQMGIRFSSFQSAVVALSLNEGAYMAEIIRSGIEAIHYGQRLAARALGMRELHVMRYVVLPQAVRVIIPPTGNQFIGMLKTSALASVVAVQDLLLTAQQTASINFDYVPTLVAAGVYYLALTSIFTSAQSRLEKSLVVTSRRPPRGAFPEAHATAPSLEAKTPSRREQRALGQEMLILEGVNKSYHGRDVVRDVTMRLRQQESVVVVGPSGSGKSTLLRCAAGLEPIDSGRVIFMGREVNSAGHAIHTIRADIGMVFQSFNLFPHMTTMGNVMLAPIKVRGIKKDEARATALRLLRKVHLVDKAYAYPDQLSGGQQQRVAIARALAMDPKVMMFDEPTSALDPEMTKEVLDVILELVDDGMTLIIVTHEMGFARRAASRVVFMDGGEVLEDIPVHEAFTSVSHPRMQQFLQQTLAT